MMNSVRAMLLFCLLFGPWAMTRAQNHLSVQLGAFQSYTAQKNAIKVVADNATVLLTAYSPEIVRVRVMKNPQADDFSYAVIQQPQATAFNFRDEGKELIAQTEKLRIVVQKKPILLHFYNREGKLLNEDATGFGVSWIGTEVTCYKKLMQDERFIGLGEKTGGLDRRENAYENWNTDFYSYQTNSDPIYSSLPFYIGLHSNVAYGIFFDNTSLLS